MLSYTPIESQIEQAIIFNSDLEPLWDSALANFNSRQEEDRATLFSNYLNVSQNCNRLHAFHWLIRLTASASDDIFAEFIKLIYPLIYLRNFAKTDIFLRRHYARTPATLISALRNSPIVLDLAQHYRQFTRNLDSLNLDRFQHYSSTVLRLLESNAFSLDKLNKMSDSDFQNLQATSLSIKTLRAF